MLERLLDGDAGKLPDRGLAERPAGRGENEPPHRLRRAALEALKNRRVLAVHRQHADAVFAGLSHHDFTGHHENFLRRHGDVLAGADRGQGRLQPGGADDGDQHDVGAWQRGQLDQSLVAGGHADAVELWAEFGGLFRRANGDQLGAKLQRLACEEFRVAARSEADEADVARQIPGHHGGAGADRTGAA